MDLEVLKQNRSSTGITNGFKYQQRSSSEKLLKNPVVHRRTKYIDIKFHYTRKLIKDGIIRVQHVKSSEQLADVLTKSLTRKKFEFNRKLLNLI